MKEWIKDIMFIVGIIGMIVGGIWATVFYFSNPDMTELRRLIECPEPTILCLVSYIIMRIGVNYV